MKPTVEVADAGRAAEWDAFVLENEQATFCHTFAWKRAIESTWGHRPIYLTASRDGVASGVLPLFFVRTIFGSMLISSPNAVYGGIAAADTASGEALVSRAIEIARDLRV